MSDSNKPLIFLEPLSDTLKKLKEVLEENSEAEGIEIFDVETVEEASQLIPTIGQAVLLTSSPKTCAVTLQSNRKYIKKLQTKTLLLTPKAIPRKTLDKFMKVGLTECIVEPVNPKTLLYKVRLQLRSISAGDSGEDGELSKKFGDESNSEDQQDNKKLRAEKGVILDDEDSLDNKKEKKKVEEETLEDYSKPVRKNTEENVIDGFYRGKNKKPDLYNEEEAQEKEKKGYKEEAIEGHYKGKLEKGEQPEEEEAATKEKLELPIMDDDLEALKREVNLEAEQDFNKVQRKQMQIEEAEAENKTAQPSLDITEEKEDKTIEKQPEDLGGHYKGEMKKGLDIDIEDEDELKQARENPEIDLYQKSKTSQLNVEQDEEEKEFLDQNEEEQEDYTPKKKAKLDLEDSPEEELTKTSLDIIEEAEDREVHKEGPDYEKVESMDSPSLQIEDDEAKDHKEKRAADQMDGHLKGEKAQTLAVEEDDLYKEDKEEQAEEAHAPKKDSVSLDLYEEESDKDAIKPEKEYPNDPDPLNQQASLDIEEDEFGRKKKDQTQQELDRESHRSQYEEDQGPGFGKGHSAHTENKKDRHNKSNARADQIKTHYSNRESIKHNDDNWDSNWDKAGKDNQEFKPLEKKNEISYEKDDLGEQTIDYAQLKKELEGIDYDREIKKKKDIGEFDQIAQVKTYTKTILDPNGALDTIEFEEIDASKSEEQESHQVYLPESKGIETVIEVLNFYNLMSPQEQSTSLAARQKVEFQSIYNYITFKVNDLFHGDLTLYFVNKEGQLELGHLGILTRLLGPKPKEPLEEDAMDKKDFKLMKKEFKEEMEKYNRDSIEIMSQWKSQWEIRLPDWKSYQTPSWRDHTFVEENNEFIFPFYEGVSLLGLAVFTPYEGFPESKAGPLEVALESVRAPMLTEYHEMKGQGKQRERSLTQLEKNNSKKKKGFFGKLWGKLAA